MLDNNTNKVVWVGVAVGAGALTLFPDTFSGMNIHNHLFVKFTGISNY